MPRKTKRKPSSSALPADILLTLSDLGLDVEKVKGDEAWALCPDPKHYDRKSSWSINLNTGEHFCFSCGFKGNYVDLVKTTMSLDDETAIAWVRKHGGIEVARRKLRGETGYTKKQAEPVTEADLALFDDPPAWALKEKDVDLESCLEYGVRWDSKHDRWIFPIREPFTNKLMGWQAKNKRVFLNHPEHVEKSVTLFGFDHLLRSKSTTAYLEESPVDATRLHTYGLDGAVSGWGVHVSDFQMDLLCDTVDTLYVCLDNDDAGRKKEAEIWANYRFRVRLMFANYEHTRKKDHGEMTPEDIEWSLDKAIHGLRYRPC